MLLGIALVVATSGTAHAFSSIRNEWQAIYTASQSYDNASCALCHGDGDTSMWNPYGWAIKTEIGGGSSAMAAILAVEGLNSDADPGGFTNLEEIAMDAQPGWTPGANNTEYDDTGTATTGLMPPTSVTGDLDPAIVTTTTTVPTTTTTVASTTTSTVASTSTSTTTVTSTTTSTATTTSTTTSTAPTATTTTTSTSSTSATSTSLSTTSTSVTSTTSTTVASADQLLSGKKLLLKDNDGKPQKRSVLVLSKDGSVALGAGDPATSSDSSIRIVSTSGGGFDDTYVLDAANWSPIKKKDPSKGWKYTKGDPIKKVLLKAGKSIKIKGKGAALGHSLGTDPQPVDIVLTVAGQRYCMQFATTNPKAFKAGKKLLVKDSLAPMECPPVGSPSGAFID